VVVASACGEHDERGGASSVVRELQVESDYGQIYIYDPQTQIPDEDATEDDNQLQRAMNDGYESRRFVGYDTGLVDLITPSQYNSNASMRIEVSEDAPPLDSTDWDHVVEVPLPVPSGTLCFQASGGGTPVETRIPPGLYRARLSGRDYVAGTGEIEGHESYRLQLWPAEEAEPRVIKYWQGYDIMRADG
jgi:hypothetical protein